MLHESKENERIEVTEVGLSFEDVYKQDYFPKEYEEELKLANLLLIPRTFRDYEIPVFPEGTLEFFEYIKDRAINTDLIPDICVSDERYRELELHSDIINLPELIVNNFALPIITSIIASYFYDKIKERKKDINATVNITVEKKGKSKKISYEGNIENFEKTMKIVSKNLFE
ncbi:hypothetical protein [uncultured Tissierella sp.]|uniref:hypothetical protein n=1 Tax=uncultured Tissierella sp. TaxID=448160 RepID=UPI0028052895|nr:hypothetical protein [uncultured Tissierella sp.]MDU5082829.1 hypothetical protein [Bacillota bacterium]